MTGATRGRPVPIVVWQAALGRQPFCWRWQMGADAELLDQIFLQPAERRRCRESGQWIWSGIASGRMC